MAGGAEDSDYEIIRLKARLCNLEVKELRTACQSGAYSPPAEYLAFTAISSAISLQSTDEYRSRLICYEYALLKLPSLISQLSDLLQKDTDLSR